MKVNRHNTVESYTTTVDWINDFSKLLVKESNFIDNLKSILPDRKYSSIEEKMADIRTRVGFDKINSSGALERPLEAEASCSSEAKGGGACGPCNSGKKCSCESGSSDKSDLLKMEAILKFLFDMSKSEPHLSPHVAISKCRDNDALGFNDLPIDMDALHSYANDIFSGDSHDIGDNVYHPHEPGEHDGDDKEAEYFRNSRPNF